MRAGFEGIFSGGNFLITAGIQEARNPTRRFLSGQLRHTEQWFKKIAHSEAE